MDYKSMSLASQVFETIETLKSRGIEIFIIDALEDGKTEEIIISKLMRHYKLSEDEAKGYFDKSSKKLVEYITKFYCDKTCTELIVPTEKTYKLFKGKYKVEGFRAGKAPRKMIEKVYGFEVFFEDAILSSFNKYYTEILDKDKSIDPIDAPDLSVEKFDDTGITIVAEIPVRPEVKLGDIKGKPDEKFQQHRVNTQ